jgi:hypothetical protein
MTISDIRSLTAPERFLYWVSEREKIRIAKEAGEPKPWTDDEILRSYKFCNVRRMDDRVSRWLVENWYRPHYNHPNVLLACSLARQLNNPESMSAVGYPLEWEPERVQQVLEERTARGLGNYSAAYMITSNYGERGRARETKAYQTVWRVCNPIHEAMKSGSVRLDRRSMQRTWNALLVFQGFSSFIAGQVVADLRRAAAGSWTDKDTWAPMGPGSVRGINRYHGRPIGTPMTQQEFITELRSLRPLLDHLPDLEMHDFQSCFCEFDKYERALCGDGRPKQKYPGV